MLVLQASANIIIWKERLAVFQRRGNDAGCMPLKILQNDFLRRFYA